MHELSCNILSGDRDWVKSKNTKWVRCQRWGCTVYSPRSPSSLSRWVSSLVVRIDWTKLGCWCSCWWDDKIQAVRVYDQLKFILPFAKIRPITLPLHGRFELIVRLRLQWHCATPLIVSNKVQDPGSPAVLVNVCSDCLFNSISMVLGFTCDWVYREGKCYTLVESRRSPCFTFVT